LEKKMEFDEGRIGLVGEISVDGEQGRVVQEE
jgi:hypothetical protein